MPRISHFKNNVQFKEQPNFKMNDMNRKPEPKDFPPESPHDLEWGGYNDAKYQIAMAQWQLAEQRSSLGFFSKGDLGGEDPEKFRLSLQVANMKREMERYLPVLEKLQEIPDWWEYLTQGTGIATINGYKNAIPK